MGSQPDRSFWVNNKTDSQSLVFFRLWNRMGSQSVVAAQQHGQPGAATATVLGHPGTEPHAQCGAPLDPTLHHVHVFVSTSVSVYVSVSTHTMRA